MGIKRYKDSHCGPLNCKATILPLLSAFSNLKFVYKELFSTILDCHFNFSLFACCSNWATQWPGAQISDRLFGPLRDSSDHLRARRPQPPAGAAAARPLFMHSCELEGFSRTPDVCSTFLDSVLNVEFAWQPSWREPVQSVILLSTFMFNCTVTYR